jgi:preprotein translocase subunit SecG
MESVEAILLVVHLIIAVALIGVVLLQRSEGGALGIGGGGGGGSLFTARGVGNTLTRATAYLALAFFITSIALTYISTHRSNTSIFDNLGVQTQQGQNQGQEGGTQPAAPEAKPAVPPVPVNP